MNTIARKNPRSDGRIFGMKTSEWKLVSNQAGFALTPSYEGNNSGEKETGNSWKNSKDQSRMW